MTSRRFALVAIGLLSACGSPGPLEAFGSPPATLTISVGQELRITMRTIGPGEYVSPPTITGSAIEFLGLVLADVQVPAGVTQVFRFRGVASGDVIIRFRNTDNRPDVSDTVRVR